jgi:AcrR family transcriptional regulator
MATSGSKSAAQIFRRPEPRDTRERILHAALDLFYAYGFHEVGLDRVIDAVGVTKTTFYNHFESREQLILEALDAREAWEGEALERGMRERAGYDPRGLLLAHLDVMDEWFNHPEYRGCMFVLACAEYPVRTDPIHRRAAKTFAAAEEQACGLAKAAGVRDPEAFARTYMMLVEGALTRRLVGGDDGAARAAREVVERMLAAEASTPAGGSAAGDSPAESGAAVSVAAGKAPAAGRAGVRGS